jgi:hypothetical protein
MTPGNPKIKAPGQKIAAQLAMRAVDLVFRINMIRGLCLRHILI